MNDFAKISYFDLKLEARSGRLPQAVGLERETARLNRILSRRLQHNANLTAPIGCGKTALIFGWAQRYAPQPLWRNKKIVLLDSANLQKIGQLPAGALASYQEAFASLENSIVVLDSFGEMIYQSPAALQNWNTLLKPLFFKDGINFILSMQPEELSWLQDNKSHFLSHFEIVRLEQPEEDAVIAILQQSAAALQPAGGISYELFRQIARLSARFPALGQLPKSALQLLDEALAESGGHNLSKDIIERLAAEKTGIPLSRLTADDKDTLRRLPQQLTSQVIGQQPALQRLAAVIQRAKLGLRSQNRPLGSFLLLGPSGVGKTETAKVLAEALYGSEKNFLRIDMSEFGESHSAARLLGSPAGYVGFEEGGQLTNHFKNYPYSLLLLDEIEKAHPKIFDIFLQIFDDGRITSARGETMDLTQSIIMATSNLAVAEILEGATAGRDVNSPAFIKTAVMPQLLRHFRPEFLNRFDEIIIYRPLDAAALTDIAFLEIAKIERRMQEHNIKFSVSADNLRRKIADLADPRFGARPVKHFIEETCENLITQSLLADNS